VKIIEATLSERVRVPTVAAAPLHALRRRLTFLRWSWFDSSR
jgi:hypothetical protein